MKAGAAIAHIHRRRTLEETFQADGKMVSKIHHTDWKKLHDSIMSKVDPIMEYGRSSVGQSGTLSRPHAEEHCEAMRLEARGRPDVAAAWPPSSFETPAFGGLGRN